MAGPLQPVPGPALDGLQLLIRHPGGEHGQDLAEAGLGAALVGFEVAGPLGLRLGQGMDLHPLVPQRADGPDGVLPGPPDAVDGQDHQGVAAGQAGVQAVLPAALLGASGAGDTDLKESIPVTPS